MKYIKLTKNKRTMVDNEDFNVLNQASWHYDSTGYASTGRRYDLGKGSTRIHTFLMRPNAPYMVDHINGNKLDNRRCNLRIVTKSQNMMNRGKTKVNKSGYKGVCWDKDNKKWVAQIKIDNRTKKIGRFTDPREAAIAYNMACLVGHGIFAKLNKV